MKSNFRKTSLTSLALAVLAISACTVSCNKNDNNGAPAESGQHFTIAAWVGDDEQYVSTAPALMEGAMTFKGNGIEVEGSRYFWHKQYVYLMNLPEKKFIQFEMMKNGTIRQVAYILTDGVVPNYFQSLNLVNDSTLLVLGAVEGNQGKAGWAQISLPDFRVKSKGEMTVPYDAAKPKLEFFVGKGFVDNGKFILGGYLWDEDAKSYIGNEVQALVYDYPAMNNMKVIKSTLTGGGIGYDYLHSLDKDEEGNHYFVVSAGKYWTGAGGKSGIVRIKKGTAEFDKDYFLDVTTLAGKQACLMGMNYVGNGIAFGTVQYEEMMTSIRDRYKNIAQVIKMDLKNKTITTMNTPLSPVGMVRHPLVYNGKYYTGIAPIDGPANLYEFDPAGDANGFKKGISMNGGGAVQVQLIAPHPKN